VELSDEVNNVLKLLVRQSLPKDKQIVWMIVADNNNGWYCWLNYFHLCTFIYHFIIFFLIEQISFPEWWGHYYMPLSAFPWKALLRVLATKSWWMLTTIVGWWLEIYTWFWASVTDLTQWNNALSKCKEFLECQHLLFLRGIWWSKF
jgi:hypothetical protein